MAGADLKLARTLRQNVSPRRGCDRNHRELREAQQVGGNSSVAEVERMFATLSQIAAVVARLALLAAGFVFFFPEPHTRTLGKSLVVSLSLAVLAAVLINVARNFGS